MSTNSIIAVPHNDDWRGRYVHWDGYPSHMGQELAAIIQRDGYQKAVKVLTEDHKSWSSILSNPETPEGMGHHPVPGYGVAHDDIPEDDDPWHYRDENDSAEWIYLLLPFGIAVYQRTEGDDNFVGLFDWSENHDWTEVEKNIYERIEAEV